MASLLEALDTWNSHWLSYGGDTRRRVRTAHHAFVHAREELVETQGRIRPWRHRGRGGPGSGQQRRSGRNLSAIVDLGLAYVRHSCHFVGGISKLRPAARPLSVYQQPRTCLGPDCLVVRGQLYVAGAELALGRRMGASALYPQAATLCGHTYFCHGGDL